MSSLPVLACRPPRGHQVQRRARSPRVAHTLEFWAFGIQGCAASGPRKPLSRVSTPVPPPPPCQIFLSSFL